MEVGKSLHDDGYSDKQIIGHFNEEFSSEMSGFSDKNKNMIRKALK